MAMNRGRNKREGCGGGREEKHDGDESEMVRGSGRDGNHEGWTLENQRESAKVKRKRAHSRKRY